MSVKWFPGVRRMCDIIIMVIIETVIHYILIWSLGIRVLLYTYCHTFSSDGIQLAVFALIKHVTHI